LNKNTETDLTSRFKIEDYMVNLYIDGFKMTGYLLTSSYVSQAQST